MAGYIRANSGWRTLQKGFIYANSGWRTVQNGFLYANGAWRQFFSSATATYTFSFGNTVHIGTNGYISLDSGQSTINIASTTGRVLGILPADLELNSIRYAADSSKFYVFYRGKRLGQTNFEIEYEVHFTDGQDYALIKLVAFPSSTYSLTGYYVNGSSVGNSRITATRTVGAEYRVYFGTTSAFATSFTEYGTSTHPVWLAQSTVTSGSSDDGYISVVANQGSSPQAPTSVTESNVTNTTATVSWTAPTSANSGMSAIQSYDYSINGGSSWTSTSTNTSVSLPGPLTANTSYTVLVRANNYFFTGTNYGTVTFSTTNITVPGAVRNLSYSLISTGARISWDAPLSDGGSAITKYQIRRDSFGFFDNSPATATTYDYTLSAGTYTVYVRAVNAIGNGPESSVSVTIPAPTPTVDSCIVITGGRSGTSPNFTWPNPKARFVFTCTNASSADVQIQYSVNSISWLDANVVQNLSVVSNQVSIQTNQPGTNIGNYYYRATCKPYSGASGTGTVGTQKITDSVQNTATAKNQAVSIS